MNKIFWIVNIGALIFYVVQFIFYITSSNSNMNLVVLFYLSKLIFLILGYLPVAILLGYYGKCIAPIIN